MKVLVGLGNPGDKYRWTRHNAGFMVLDLLAEENKVSWGGSSFDGLVTRCEILGRSCLLVKPQTWMNLSGKCVAPLLRYFKVETSQIVAVYDDLDVPAGQVRARVGGGHAGHNGVRSLIDELHTSDFHRVKMGIGRPDATSQQGVAEWVLSAMSETELEWIRSVGLKEAKVRLEGVFKQMDAK